MEEPELIKTIWGFFQYKPLPSDEYLQEYYAKKYYQDGLSGYEISYSEEETAWKRLRHWLFYQKAMQILPEGKKTFLDVGCGEGWFMEEFYRNDHSVKGLDFSRAGIEKLHPHLLPFFQQGNIYKLLDNIIKADGKFDIIGLCHVLEHVKWPEELIKNIKTIMHSRSLLIVSAPNDFSPLHKYLIEKK